MAAKIIGLNRVVTAMDQKVELINEKVKAFYLQGLGQIKIQTPKDEATAQRAWNFKIGSPSKSDSGNEVVMPAFILNKKLYYANNTPYIGTLEYGGYKGLGEKTIHGLDGNIYSDQAPGGWVRDNVQLIKLAIRSL